jgi:Immunoglobulin domain
MTVTLISIRTLVFELELSCYVFNEIWLTLARVSHKIAEPPVIETAPADQNATEGSTVVFKCRAQGSPRVTTQWLFNGQPVVNGQFISIRGTWPWP